MNNKKYKQLRIGAAFFVGAIVSVAVTKENFLLATVGVLTGMIFMSLVRSKAKVRTDERELSIQEKAARITYSIFTPILGLTAFLLFFPSKSGVGVFSKGEWLFTESIGMLLSYLTLFLMAIYAIAYYYFSKKFGGGGEE